MKCSVYWEVEMYGLAVYALETVDREIAIRKFLGAVGTSRVCHERLLIM